ncbi:MAG TPA: anthranilate phosphoribosyltransferase, partial [Actinomycetota bacterium]
MTDFWPSLLGTLLAGQGLERYEAAEAMRRVMSGEATPAQVAAFVVALRAKGETAEEVAGLAEAMLELAP